MAMKIDSVICGHEVGAAGGYAGQSHAPHQFEVVPAPGRRSPSSRPQDDNVVLPAPPMTPHCAPGCFFCLRGKSACAGSAAKRVQAPDLSRLPVASRNLARVARARDADAPASLMPLRLGSVARRWSPHPAVLDRTRSPSLVVPASPKTRVRVPLQRCPTNQRSL